MSNKTRYALLLATIIVVVAGIFYFEQGRISTSDITKEAEIELATDKNLPKVKEIVRPSGYVNSEAFEIGDFVGEKVILIDFMTYTCINCQRTWPYLNAWHEKYKDQGLQIIGVHTPEFDFEKEIENVEDAAERFGLEFPIVLDNDYGTWRAYGNRYWPRKYLIDKEGYIVYDHIGEGDYDETEMKIKELLGLDDDVIVDPEGVQIVKKGVRYSPETYFGAGRNEYLGNGKSGRVGVASFEEPDTLKSDMLYLVGDWDIQDEYAESKSKDAKILYKYNAAKVFFVAESDEPVEIDVNGENSFEVQNEMLYTVVDNPEGYGEYMLEITVSEQGVRIYAFTFG